MFIRLDKTPEPDKQTERRTGGQTDRHTLAITAVCAANSADAL